MKTATRWTARLLTLTTTALFLAVGLGPHTGAYRTLTVLTGSMAPTIPAGSVVFVRPIAPADIAVGDVLTYNIPVDDQRVVTHRVTDIVEAGATPTVVTKGDAVEDVDPWTTQFSSGPVWKVEADVPFLGYGLQALQTPLARRISVTVLPVLFALSWLWRIWRPSNRDAGSEDGAPDAGPATVEGPSVSHDERELVTAGAPARSDSFPGGAPAHDRVAL